MGSPHLGHFTNAPAAQMQANAVPHRTPRTANMILRVILLLLLLGG